MLLVLLSNFVGNCQLRRRNAERKMQHYKTRMLLFEDSKQIFNICATN